VKRAFLFYNQTLGDLFYDRKGNLYCYRILKDKYLQQAKVFTDDGYLLKQR